MQDIARESEYGIGTLYLYFKDKEELYLSLIEAKMGKLIEYVDSRVRDVKDPLGKLRSLVNAHLTFFQENRDFFKIYFAERNRAGGEMKGKITKSAINTMLSYINYIGTVVKEAISRGEIKKYDPRRLGYILGAMINSVVFPTLREGSDEDLTRFGDFIIEIFLHGVAQK
jgi:AcrR family transcriptional regulator